MENKFLDRNLALEAVRVTEAAALSSSLLMGRGDEKAADQNAVTAMRYYLNNLSISLDELRKRTRIQKIEKILIGKKSIISSNLITAYAKSLLSILLRR